MSHEGILQLADPSTMELMAEHWLCDTIVPLQYIVLLLSSMYPWT
jgi:hypothetical protein